jgi:hypothetical protein
MTVLEILVPAILIVLLLPYIGMALFAVVSSFAYGFIYVVDKPDRDTRNSPKGVYGYCWMPLWQKLRRKTQATAGPLP